MGVGTKMRLLRNRTKYSQKDLADMLQVDRSTYVNWENETTDIKAQFLPKIAEIFEVEIND